MTGFLDKYDEEETKTSVWDHGMKFIASPEEYEKSKMIGQGVTPREIALEKTFQSLWISPAPVTSDEDRKLFAELLFQKFLQS